MPCCVYLYLYLIRTKFCLWLPWTVARPLLDSLQSGGTVRRGGGGGRATARAWGRRGRRRGDRRLRNMLPRE